jgi:hypothetical protein
MVIVSSSWQLLHIVAFIVPAIARHRLHRRRYRTLSSSLLPLLHIVVISSGRDREDMIRQ